MNARELHDATLDLLEKGVDRLCYGTDERQIVLRALDLLARTEESTDELVQELRIACVDDSGDPLPDDARIAAEADAESNRKDAELGQILMRYIDRLDDPVPDDALPDIVAALIKDAMAAIDAAKGKP